MKPLNIVRSLLCLMTCLLTGAAIAASEATSSVQQTIPFKPDKGAMAGAGVPIFLFLLIFIGLAYLLYYLKKQDILKIGAVYKDDAIKILGVKRLSTKTTAFVIEANGAEVLIVQTNDNTHLLQLNAKKE